MKKKKFDSDFRTIGKSADTINVEISYRIIQLFSEGLYSSPNKAIEELVSNSFDAGAVNVRVADSADLSSPDAYIAVIDDGVSMDIDGLKQHWQIGSSDKREGSATKNKRKQIGKFGIGKLATYVLADELTHFCKVNKKFYAITMDYTRIGPGDSDAGIYSKDPIQLSVREVSEAEALDALAKVMPEEYLKAKDGPILFGNKASKTWTIALMTKLKPMAQQKTNARLQWVLSTAMPLGPDFQLYLNEDKIVPSKESIKIAKTWIIGKDIKAKIPKPAPDDLETAVDKNLKKSEVGHFGLKQKDFGRMYGKVELYEDLLTTGKDPFQRSHGFFVYARGRLINLLDPYFGIDSNLLKHGTFARFRAEVHIDSLDGMLQSSREGVRESPNYEVIKDTLRGIFNLVRAEYEKDLEKTSREGAVSNRIADSPKSLSNRPLAFIAERLLSEGVTSKYITVPKLTVQSKITEFLESLNESDGISLVQNVELEELGVLLPIAHLNLETKVLHLNTLHPFVAYHLDEAPDATKSMELLGMVEILTEAYLAQAGVSEDVAEEVLRKRDDMMRSLARARGPQPAQIVARELVEAKTSQKNLEVQLNESFRSLGLDVTAKGGPNKPDGVAEAILSGTTAGKRSYRISLEAKSKEDGKAKLSAKALGAAGIRRHLDEHDCDHAIVAAPDFDTTRDGKTSATYKEIQTALKDSTKTITLIKIDDLAKLVKGAPKVRLSPARLKELFSCTLPEESAEWVTKVLAEKVEEMPAEAILKAIWEEVKETPGETVEISQVQTALRKGTPKIAVSREQLTEMLKAMMAAEPKYIKVIGNNIEMNQKPEKILPTIRKAFSLTASKKT